MNMNNQMKTPNVGVRNAIVLSLAQAFNGAIGAIAISLGALGGAWLVSEKLAFATLPVATYSAGSAIFAMPVAFLGRKFGRKVSFIIGSLIGILGAVMSIIALQQGAFGLFCASYFLIGGAGAFIQQYRFAAADTGSDKFKSRAISWVLTGGVLAAFIGTEVVLRTKDLFLPLPFAGAFLGMAGLLLAGIGVLLCLKPVGRNYSVEGETSAHARPISEIVQQPVFIVALLCAVASYALMTFMMTGAPLAMKHHGHTEAEAVLGIRWHVLAMFGPSFFTGALIVRFGKLPIIAIGLVLLIVSSGFALAGLELWNFWTSLVFLGVGWNFGFIGATTLLGEAYHEAEKNKVQGLHDFILFTLVAAASLASGVTLNSYGWGGIALVIFPVSVLAALSLLWLKIIGRKSV